MSKWTEYRHYLNPIHAIDDVIEWANDKTPKNTPSFYVGTDGTYVGEPAEIIMDSKLPGHGSEIRTQPTQNKPTQNKPTGYSRVTAATAKDIAQGGMTKDEVIEFNIRHPNETAKRSE